MAIKKTKKLELLKKQQEVLQEKIKKEEAEIRQQLVCDLANFLVDTDAFHHIELDIILGGLLDVAEQAKTNMKQAEVWKEAGVKFRKIRRKTKPSKTSSDAKKAA
jgi:hypothetical protein